MKKNRSFHRKVACYKGWASLEWRRGVYLALENSLLSVLSSLEQCDIQTTRDAQSPTCKTNTSVIKRFTRSSALCYTYLYKALDTSIQNKSFGCL